MQARTGEAVTAGDSPDRDDQFELPGPDGAGQQVDDFRVVAHAGGCFSFRYLIHRNGVVQASRMRDRRDRTEPVLDPRYCGGYAGRVIEIDDFVADAGSGRPQVFEARNEFAVIVLACPADYRHPGAAAGDNLSEREASALRRPGDHDDVFGAERDVTTAGQIHLGQDGFADSVFGPEHELAEHAVLG